MPRKQLQSQVTITAGNDHSWLVDTDHGRQNSRIRYYIDSRPEARHVNSCSDGVYGMPAWARQNAEHQSGEALNPWSASTFPVAVYSSNCLLLSQITTTNSVSDSSRTSRPRELTLLHYSHYSYNNVFK